MLVCPQCQFENPNLNKFCQKCGTSLTHKNCPECGTTVALDAENCLNCGALTGTVWWAIVVEQAVDEAVNKEQSAAQDTLTENKPVEISSNGQYLDPGRRYRLIAADEENSLKEVQLPFFNLVFQGKVVDCQPLQKSVLETLIEQKTDGFEDVEEGETLKDSDSSVGQQIGIPELAWLYLTLQKFSPTVPKIHDAWPEGSKEVILLSDRSQWQLLSEHWSQKPLSTRQIVEQLNEMLTLWEALSQVHCCQSLLLDTNLRVNEDGTFGLQQLYRDPPNTQPTLQELAQRWQQLLQQSGQEPTKTLTQRLEQVAQGTVDEFDSPTQLRLQLQELVDESAENFDESASNPVSSELQTTTQETIVNENKTEEAGLLIETSESEGDDLSTALFPMQLLSLADAGCTDIGRQRPHNEDYFGIQTRTKKQQSNRGEKLQALGLYIVCDGMGGHASGEIASAMAVETLQRYFKPHWRDRLPDQETIERGVLLANQTIYQMNQQNASSGSGRMGTTLVMALLHNTKIAIAHVGDSRIYRVNRKWGLEQLTVDHEVGQRAIQEGIEPQLAYSRPDAYQLTQALGPHDNHLIKPDVRFLELYEDTLLLLSSDGLSDNELIEKHWQTHLSPLLSSGANLDKGLRKLIDLANQQNGHDNITGILVRVKVRPQLES